MNTHNIPHRVYHTMVHTIPFSEKKKLTRNYLKSAAYGIFSIGIKNKFATAYRSFTVCNHVLICSYILCL